MIDSDVREEMKEAIKAKMMGVFIIGSLDMVFGNKKGGSPEENAEKAADRVKRNIDREAEEIMVKIDALMDAEDFLSANS